MKLLLFSDVHCDENACRALVEQSKEVDVVVAAGDIGNMRKGLEETIAHLVPIEKPTILVPGNSESEEELTQACAHWPAAHVLHASGIEIEGVSFYGVGGGIPVTPFGSWSYDFDEAQAEEMLAACPEGCVLVTHSPPKGAGDLASSGDHFGSEAVRSAIVDKQPLLAVCGHIHEASGSAEKIGEVPVVNAGPRGVIWEL